MSTEPMRVRALNAGEGETPFSTALPLMASAQWQQTFPEHLRAYGVFDGMELAAVLVLQERRRLLVRIVTDPDLSPHCGLIFREQPGNAEKRNSSRKRVMTALAGFLDRTRWGIVSITFPDWITDFQPFVWRGFKVLVRYTYQIRLGNRPDDELLGEMNSTRRNEIRNGHKKDLAVALCEDPTIVEQLVAKTYKRQSVSANMSQVRALLVGFARPDNSFAYVTRKAGVPVAACFCIHDAKRAYYVLGGVDDVQGVGAAAPMAMFACIRQARDRGLERYDFEGSMVPGIEHYFRSFGGDLTPLYRVVKASLPIEMALKPFRRSIF
jgi:hypothetical protein